MSEQRPNLGGRLARAFITSKLTIVFILGIVILGVLAMLLTPREENPQILVPGTQVSVTLPGASAKEVEELVVIPLEGILSEMTGVDHTNAIALNSVGIVTVQFKVGQSKELSLVKLYNSILSNRGRLPADAGMPQIKSEDADNVPVVTVTLASPGYDDYALRRLADRMAERLHSLDNVSVVTVRGGHDREIRIELDPDQLQAFGLTIGQVAAAFDSSNLSVPLQKTVRKNAAQAIELKGFFTSADDVRDQIIVLHEGRPVYVKDVAVVKDGPPTEIDKLSRFTFGPADKRFQSLGLTEMPAVTIAVAKKKGSNAVLVTNSVIDRIESMKAEFVPQDVQVVVTRDDGQKANVAVNTLLEHLAISIVTVSLILMMFLGWKEALVVTLAAPLVLFVTGATDLFCGITINRVTLFALILSLGLLVDDAIVVIENIHRHYNQTNQQDKQETTIEAANEIGNATSLATLVIMAVFVSMLLVTGMPGAYFHPVIINVPVAMAASFMVAYIVTPWAANRWISRPREPDGNKNKEPATTPHPDLLRRIYLPLIRPLQEKPKARLLFVLFILLLMTCSILQGAWQFIRPSGVGGPQSFLGVNLGFLPKDNENTFNIVIGMAETSPVEQTDRLAREIGQLLARDKNVLNYQTWIGEAGVADVNALQKGTADNQGSYVGEIRVNLIDKNQRSASSIKIVRELRPRIYEIRNRYPGAKVSLVEDPPGPPMQATVLAEIHGPGLDGLRTLSAQVSHAFADTYDTVDLSDSEPVDVVEHQIIPDKEKAALSNVSVARIAQTLRLVYGGTVVSRAHLADEVNPVDVRAFVPRSHEVDPTRLDRTYVDNAQGQKVPLSELVKVVQGKADRPIRHKDDERVTFVGAELGSSVPLYAVLDLNHRLDGMKAPDGRPLRTGNLTLTPQVPNVINGYELLWGGEMRLTLDSYRDMTEALGAALTVIFLVLVAYYRSFVIPMIALAPVPLGIIGILPGHWITSADFSATSMIGIIALSGVVIRGSLLIIDFIQDNQRQGMPLEEAVREAGAVRLRPILLTTLAIVLGSAIMVTDPVFGGLAISLIFGTVVSTALTVFVVPILYYMYALRQKYQQPVIS
ncbi:MAG: efflux RND transporter permease subunit [Oryzomonas sp.]